MGRDIGFSETLRQKKPRFYAIPGGVTRKSRFERRPRASRCNALSSSLSKSPPARHPAEPAPVSGVRWSRIPGAAIRTAAGDVESFVSGASHKKQIPRCARKASQKPYFNQLLLLCASNNWHYCSPSLQRRDLSRTSENAPGLKTRATVPAAGEVAEHMYRFSWTQH